MSSPHIPTAAADVSTNSTPAPQPIQLSSVLLPKLEPIPHVRKVRSGRFLAVEDTDVSMAELVCDLYGHRIAIVPVEDGAEGGIVSIFDPDDGMWQRGQSGQLRNMITGAARAVRHAANQWNPEDDAGQARKKKLLSGVSKYHSNQNRRSASAVVMDMKELRHPANHWETLGLEIPFRNRVKLNAKTGAVTQILPEDRFLYTMACDLPRRLDTDVSNTLVVRTINQIFEGREELLEFFREALFYTLLGDKQDKAYFYIHGPGNTGKTVLLIILRALMGSYWELANSSVVEMSRDGEERRFTLGRFEYVRCLAVDETGAGRQLSAQTIKSLTGGNDIEYERKFQERSRYVVRFALWIASNFEPDFVQSDDAAADRLRLFHLTRVFKTHERELKYKSVEFWRDHVQDLFIWIWQAQAAYWQNRLTLRPNSMTVEIAENSRDNDPLGQAVEFICEPLEGCSITVSEMFKYVKLWRAAHGNSERYSSKLMKKQLRDKGYRIDEKDRILGLKLNDDNVEELNSPNEWSFRK